MYIGSFPSINSYGCCMGFSFDVKDKLMEARIYAQEDEALFHYIQRILNSEAFQSDPKGFLQKWDNAGGQKTEFSFEGEARAFFHKHFKF